MKFGDLGPRAVWARAGAALLLALAAACSDQTDEPAGQPDETILVGSFNFTEGKILANLYAEVLRSAGFDVEILEHVASREIMEPALEQGHVDIVPEYQGTLLRFLHPESEIKVEPDAGHALDVALEERGLVSLEPTPGENQNVVVVTLETAEEYDLVRISDLDEVAGEMTFGGPPECPARPLCLQGLADVYGLEFKSFHSLDAGGPLTLAALEGGEIDAGLLFGTDPALDGTGLVVLRDDRDLQPAEHVVPVMREEVLIAGSDEMSDRLNELSARLTTDALRSLNARVDNVGLTPTEAALEWLEFEGLI